MKQLVFGMILLSCGCATIVKGGRTTVDVRSSTPEAVITIKSFNGTTAYEGPSPAHVVVSKEYAYTVEVTAPDHKPRKQVINKSISGWMFGNLIWILPIFWGVGIAVDAASGALWSLDPEDMSIKLVKLPPQPPPPIPPAPPQESDTPKASQE